MINQFLTIAKVANELKNKCISSHIIDCLSFRKNEFLIQFSNRKQFSVFLYSAKPFVYVSDADKIPADNLFHLFKTLTGKRLEQVKLHRNDRILKLEFSDQFNLFIQLFSATSGMTLIGSSYEETYKNAVTDTNDDNYLEIEAVLSDQQLIESNLRFFPDWMLQEIKRSVTIESIKRDLINYQSYWIYQGKVKKIISPFEISGLQPGELVQNGSVQIKYTVIGQVQAESFDKEKNALTKNMVRRISQLQSTIEQLRQYIKNEFSLTEFEHHANLLYSQPDLTTKGKDSITVSDVLNDPEKNITIKLTPNLTLLENANLLYQRIKKFREMKNEKSFLLQRKSDELQAVQKTSAELETVSTPAELRAFKKRNQNFLKEHASQETAVSEPFHRIRSVYGYEILIGKHAKGNDFLLSSVSKKNDVWFHCKGDSGSHVILSHHTKEMPDKKQLEEAARYAAYFSGQRNSDWVPVTYTFCKYVRKVKGGAPGAVFLEREDVIFVKPVKPERQVT